MTAQADVNRDGIVNFSDFLTFAVSFGTDSPAFDFNVDGEVGFVDFIHLSSRFGHVSLFYNANLETAVRDPLERPVEQLLPQDVAEVRSLSFVQMEITSLTGLEYFERLGSLDLSHNRIRDLTPLTGLTELATLALRFNQIENLTAIGSIHPL